MIYLTQALLQNIAPESENITLENVNEWIEDEPDEDFDEEECNENSDDNHEEEPNLPSISRTSIDDGLLAVRVCLNIAVEHSCYEHIHNLQKFQEYLVDTKINSSVQSKIQDYFKKSN